MANAAKQAQDAVTALTAQHERNTRSALEDKRLIEHVTAQLSKMQVAVKTEELKATQAIRERDAARQAQSRVAADVESRIRTAAADAERTSREQLETLQANHTALHEATMSWRDEAQRLQQELNRAKAAAAAGEPAPRASGSDVEVATLRAVLDRIAADLEGERRTVATTQQKLSELQKARDKLSEELEG